MSRAKLVQGRAAALVSSVSGSSSVPTSKVEKAKQKLSTPLSGGQYGLLHGSAATKGQRSALLDVLNTSPEVEALQKKLGDVRDFEVSDLAAALAAVSGAPAKLEAMWALVASKPDLLPKIFAPWNFEEVSRYLTDTSRACLLEAAPDDCRRCIIWKQLLTASPFESPEAATRAFQATKAASAELGAFDSFRDFRGFCTHPKIPFDDLVDDPRPILSKLLAVRKELGPKTWGELLEVTGAYTLADASPAARALFLEARGRGGMAAEYCEIHGSKVSSMTEAEQQQLSAWFKEDPTTLREALSRFWPDAGRLPAHAVIDGLCSLQRLERSGIPKPVLEEVCHSVRQLFPRADISELARLTPSSVMAFHAHRQDIAVALKHAIVEDPLRMEDLLGPAGTRHIADLLWTSAYLKAPSGASWSAAPEALVKGAKAKGSPIADDLAERLSRALATPKAGALYADLDALATAPNPYPADVAARRDPFGTHRLGEHMQIVARLTRAFLEDTALSPRVKRVVIAAAVLHDIGRLERGAQEVNNVVAAERVLDQVAGLSPHDRRDVLLLIQNDELLGETLKAIPVDRWDPKPLVETPESKKLLARLRATFPDPELQQGLNALYQADVRGKGRREFEDWHVGPKLALLGLPEFKIPA